MEETCKELPNFAIGIDFLGPDPMSSEKKKKPKKTCKLRVSQISFAFDFLHFSRKFWAFHSQLSVNMANWIKCSLSNQSIKMWRVFDQLMDTFVYFFVRYENFALYHNKKSFFAQIIDVALL